MSENPYTGGKNDQWQVGPCQWGFRATAPIRKTLDEAVSDAKHGDRSIDEIVTWLLGLEGGLERVIRGEMPSSTTERRDLQARRGIYEGIADDIKRKWGRP